MNDSRALESGGRRHAKSRWPVRRRTYFAAAAWPVLAVGLQVLRLGAFDPAMLFSDLQGIALLEGFALVGICSELALTAAEGLASNNPHGSRIVGAGYLIFVPVAYMTGVIGPLALEGLRISMTESSYYLVFIPVAMAFWGTVPLVFGCTAGVMLARLQLLRRLRG